MTTLSEMLTTREVADRFRVEPESVRRWVTAGKLKVTATTPGGRLRFSEEDIREMNGYPEASECVCAKCGNLHNASGVR